MKIKKLLSICLSVALLLSVVATGVVSATSGIPALDETKAFIKATSTPVKRGEIAKVTFTVGNNKGFWGINQTYKFDTSVLSFVEGETNEFGTFPKYEKGEKFKSSLISPINDKGEFTFNFTEIYNDVEIKTNKENGELFSIYLKVAEDAPAGTYNIDMVDYNAENFISLSGKPVEFTFNQPTVVVLSENDPSQTDPWAPTTTTTTTTTTTEAETEKWPPEVEFEINDECLLEIEALGSRYFKFVPITTATYSFSLPDYADSSVCTYDEWGEIVGYFGETGRECYMESGKIYYITVYSEKSTILTIDNLETAEKPTAPTESTTTSTTTTTVVETPSSSATQPTVPSEEPTQPTQSSSSVPTQPTQPTQSTTKPTQSETQPTVKPTEPTESTTVHEHLVEIQGKKTATYFAKGYTGDVVCEKCGQLITKGKATAKKTLKIPKFKLTSGKKQFKVKYTKVTGATGFQVRYKIKGKWKLKKFDTKKTATKIVRNLKKGKYQVQIRAYVKSGKKFAYSKWAKVQKVNVK